MTTPSTLELLIGHPANAEASIEFGERAGEPLKIRGVSCRHAVEVGRLPGRSMDRCGDAADDQVLDAMAIQGFEDASDVQPGLLIRPHEVSSSGAAGVT
jgi:hypothetical protein